MSGLSRRLAQAAAVLRDAWLRVRPASPRGALLATAAIVGLSAALAVVFFVGAVALASFASEYGFHPDTNADAWRARSPVFGTASRCADCHGPEQAKLTSATHAGIGCESCHGPLGAHALASPGTREAEANVATPTDAVCVTCHVAAVGRPVGFRQIVPADHYVTTCLQCHDPHTGISKRPPVVQHPLDRLPECVTCHGPEGFKARDQRHPTVSDEDAVCLSCHLPGRGPDGGQASP
jgi:hypothetical protein